ncbi:MAG: serine hydrolase [Flavobacteriales bacterium]|nr:serine hydrolase [Flavobacteriales bacterium]
MRIFHFTDQRYAIALALTTLPFLSCGQQKEDTHAQQYARYLSEAHARGQFNGNALVVEHGELVYQGSFGIKSIDPVAPLTLNSVFRLGSVSKQFTAMAIMMLREQGKLEYDQDIRDFLPELPYEGITIRHLLNHVSGLPDYNRLMDENWKTDLTFTDPKKSITGNEDCVKMLAELHPPVLFKPSEKWEYSNTGYMLLATMVVRISGVSFATYLHDHVFEPAGMSHTVVYHYVLGPDANMPDRAFGFSMEWNGVDMLPDDVHYLNAAHGDGGVFSTVGDLMKWDRILYTDKLVSRKTLEEAFTPSVLANGDTTDYGFGWFIERTPAGKKVVHHSGGWLGFITNIRREIDEDNCIILLTNNSTRYFGLTDGLDRILHDQPSELPRIFIRDAIRRTVQDEGVEAAIAKYKKLKAERQRDYLFEEQELNVFGYQLLWADRVDDAVAILRLNMEEYPRSANVYDSFGDVLLANGDTAAALTNFKKTLAMDPAFAGLQEKIKGLEEGVVPARK